MTHRPVLKKLSVNIELLYDDGIYLIRIDTFGISVKHLMLRSSVVVFNVGLGTWSCAHDGNNI